ncbi:MAG: Ni/Fe-hydrogenase cytochrome b subunit [Candidatus Krumholzibacteriia bacterium]|nr:Ni/Fe-hydrogenase cytochrome b subunit [bacterium]MCB9516122.1 Ni/Fe-hydrogenase cytochrome b subunit [Candidatus Latescibacterota bacterium]
MSDHPSRPLFYPLRTRGMLITLAVMAVGAFFGAKRFLVGIGSVTNLNDQYPWGLWIGFDVATGVALAAGGFTTAALVYIFGKERFHAVIRPALLTAALGYTFVVLGLLADLGRYWAVWHPILPSMWQGNSVLFEVGMCVMIYLSVLYVEFAPIVLERLREVVSPRGRARRMVDGLKALLDRVLFLFIIAGVVLSCLHQSSLGNLMVIAPSKVHPLWWTPILPLLFLLSAFAVGLSMAIFESLLASKGFRRAPEMDVLAPLARVAAPLIALYLAFKLGDLTLREAWHYAFVPGGTALAFWIEILGGLVLPIAIFVNRRLRSDPRWLLLGSAAMVLGVALNRINVFIVAYHPPYAEHAYLPSFGEFAVSAGLVATFIFIYRLAVTYLPVMPVNEEETHA